MAIRQRTPDLAQSEGLRTVKRGATHSEDTYASAPPFRSFTMKQGAVVLVGSGRREAAVGHCWFRLRELGPELRVANYQ
jgi:hypothetical protein